MTRLTQHTTTSWIGEYTELLTAHLNGKPVEDLIAARRLGANLAHQGITAETIAAAHLRWLADHARDAGAIGADTIEELANVLTTVLRGHADAGEILGTSSLAAVEGLIRGEETGLSAVFHNSTVGIGITDAAGRFCATNPALQHMLGYAEPELLGRHVHEFTDPEFLAREMKQWARLAAGQDERLQLTKKYIHKHGQAVWARVTLSVIRDHAGRPVYAIGLVEDVSERVRAQRALRDSEERLRALCETAPIAMYLLDQRGRCLYVNPRYEQLMGINAHACLGKPWCDHLQCLDENDLADALARCLSTGAELTREIRVDRADEHQRWVSIRIAPLITDHAGSALWLGTIEDITARRRSDETLRESEAKFRALAETVPAAILIYDATGYRYVNTMMEEMTGYSRDELLNMHFWEFIEPEMQAAARERGLARLAGQEVTNRYELRLIHKDGSERWVDYSGTRIEYDGHPAVLGVALDITRRKQDDAEVQKRQLELQHLGRVSTLGMMSSEIAHELNQPLAAILNYANGCSLRLRSHDADCDEIHEIITEIRDEAERAGQIIRRIRGFVRRQTPQQLSTDLAEIVREATALAMATIARGEMTLQLDLADDLPLVYVDRLQITQVLVNLVRNAVDAIRAVPNQTGTITVTTRRHDARTVAVSVHDTGPGFTAQTAAQLFEPFVTSKRDGLGLGLSISRSIVEAHGGTLTATNDAPHGTTFRFTLPLTEGDQAR